MSASYVTIYTVCNNFTRKPDYIHNESVKVTLEQATKGPEGEQMYSSTLPSTSVLDVEGGQRYAPAAFPPPGKTLYPVYRRLCGPQGRFGMVRKISPPTGVDPQTVQPVAGRYTDWAMAAPMKV